MFAGHMGGRHRGTIYRGMLSVLWLLSLLSNVIFEIERSFEAGQYQFKVYRPVYGSANDLLCLVALSFLNRSSTLSSPWPIITSS